MKDVDDTVVSREEELAASEHRQEWCQMLLNELGFERFVGTNPAQSYSIVHDGCVKQVHAMMLHGICATTKRERGELLLFENIEDRNERGNWIEMWIVAYGGQS